MPVKNKSMCREKVMDACISRRRKGNIRGGFGKALGHSLRRLFVLLLVAM
jgi:hypothetical protein